MPLLALASVCIFILAVCVMPAPAAEVCTDAGVEGGKYSCTDFACLKLCHLSHVKKLCQKSCGLCGNLKTVGLPSAPLPPSVVTRTSSSVTLMWDPPADSLCPIKQIELAFQPPVRGRKTMLLTSKGKAGEQTVVRGLFGDIKYEVYLRVKSSFGWSPSSSPMFVQRVGWREQDATGAGVTDSARGHKRESSTVQSLQKQTVKATSITATATTTTAAAASRAPGSNTPPLQAPVEPNTPLPKNEEIHKQKKKILLERARKEAREHMQRVRESL